MNMRKSIIAFAMIAAILTAGFLLPASDAGCSADDTAIAYFHWDLIEGT